MHQLFTRLDADAVCLSVDSAQTCREFKLSRDDPVNDWDTCDSDLGMCVIRDSAIAAPYLSWGGTRQPFNSPP